jgi:type I restriction enzyme S subunit
MSQGWRMAPLGEVLIPYREYIDAPEPKLYPKLSVKLYGKGVTLDTPADGATLKMKRHQIARSSQVILSEIWGKKGAIGFVPPEGDGALCTSHFFLFDVSYDRIDPKYLQAIFTANYLEDQLRTEAKGTTGYAAVRPKNLLAAEIPLPPLAEQRRIVARIEELATKIEEARRLREESSAQSETLCAVLLFDCREAVLTPMRDLVRLRETDTTVEDHQEYLFAGVYSFGKGVFRGSVRAGMAISYRSLTRLRQGDFVYPKLMAWEGALGIVPPECEGLFVSPEFPVFEVDRTRVLPEVLDAYYRSSSVWPLLAEISTGTNVRRRRLQPSAFLQFKMPLPPMETQQRLRDAKQRLEVLRPLQTKVAEELSALLPSVLDKALTGEL